MILMHPGPQLTEKDVARFEKKHRTPLPESYRTFILRQNGGAPVRTSYHGRGGIKTGVQTVYELGGMEMKRAVDLYFPKVIKRGLLPVADTGGGDFIFVSLNTGATLLWDHEKDVEQPHEDDLLLLEPSLEHLLAKLEGPIVYRTPDWMANLAERGGAVDLDTFLLENDLETANDEGLTLAQLAARAGNLPLLRACLAREAKLAGAMALAATGGQREIVEFLLSQGCNINEKFDGEYPIWYASHVGPEFLDFLLERGAIDIFD
jgi:ankyrin repeat protein